MVNLIKILTSQVDSYTKINGEKIVKEIGDTNKFVTQIKNISKIINQYYLLLHQKMILRKSTYILICYLNH